MCGPSLIRLPGRSAIVPGQPFEYDYDPAHEAMALASGAITLLPGEISAADRIAAAAAAEAEARAKEAAAPTVVDTAQDQKE